MKSLIFLFASLVVVSGSSWHKFISKYATIKVLSSCLGEDFMMQWHTNYTKIVDSCSNSDPEMYTRLMYTRVKPGLQSDDGTVIDTSSQNDFVPLDQFNPFGLDQFQGPGLVDLNDVLNALQGGSNQPVLLVPIPPQLLRPTREQQSGYFIRRSKRDVHLPYFDQEKIAQIHRAVLFKASNFTCVVHKLKIFNSNYDVNTDIILNQLESLSLDAGLKNDIIEGITDCIRYTDCKPLKKMTFVPSSVQRAASFLKCELKQKLSSCVKYDLQMKQHKFDKEALKQFGNNEQMDEGDKMFALIYGDMTGDSKGF